MDQKAFFFIASSKKAIQCHFVYFMNKSISNSRYFQWVGLLKRMATYQAKKMESILFLVHFRLDFFFRNLWTWPYFAHLKYVKGQTPYRSVLDFWRNNLKKSSSINWIFSLFWTRFLMCVAWKNQFRNWFLQAINPVCQTWFLQLDFPKIRYR